MRKRTKNLNSFTDENFIKQVNESARIALDYAEKRDYEGYSKFDAFNSPFLKAISLNNQWIRLILSQLVMRAPINLRPWVGVRKGKNPKGLGLFAQAYLNFYQYFKEVSYLDKARYCLAWLESHASLGYSGYCWGYNFDWQNYGFYAPAGMPNAVVTTFIAQAFVEAYEVTGEKRFLTVAHSAVDFLTKDLPILIQTDTMMCLSYVPVENRLQVINVNGLIGALLARLYYHTQEISLREQAQRLIYYVVDKQTDYGAWYYTDPPGDSPIRHDNYHTGFVLDALLDYMDSTIDRQHESAYEQGLRFYLENLFLANGAPKFMSDQVYPLDIHGAAQGIITLTRSGKPECLELATQVARWAIKTMQDSNDGHFYYQQTRLYTKSFSLMRWNQAWMVYALSCLLKTTQ